MYLENVFAVNGTVARRKNCGRNITFLHVVLDKPLAYDPLNADSALAVGTTVQLVCTDDMPAPRLARGGARVEAKGILETGSDWQASARTSILVKEICLVDPPPENASSAAPAPTKGSTLCRDWLRNRCAKGDKCEWRHFVADADEAAKIAASSARAASARAGDDFAEAEAAEAEFSCVPCGPVLKFAKGSRHTIFASWIVDTFGSAALHRGSGVVDVAGGKGLISLELALAHGLPCTVLDPRKARPSAPELRHIRQRCTTKPGTTDEGTTDEGSRVPELGGYNGKSDSTPKEPDGYSIKSKSGSIRFAESLVTYVQMCLPDGVDADGGEYVEADGALPWLENASLLFGMHSDEATEAIVDVALRQKLNFAVVPCCAFPSRFPDRRLKGGEPVTTTAQFMKYLKAKAPEGVIRQAWLPFEGRNAVLYVLN